MFSYDTKKSKISSISKDMFLLLILIIETSTGYDLECPAKAEWKLKANATCSLEEKYVCLFNVLEKKYQDNCLGSDRSSIGSKLVFQPLFNLADCDAKQFQPIVFTTHGNSDCLLLKSKCDEEGQVVYINGSFSNDTVCRCDYTEGYAFVSKPKNSCFCKPSEEDCSCFKVKCSKLTPDYQCLTDGKESPKTKCQELYPHISHKRQNRTDQDTQSSTKRFSDARLVTCIIIATTGLYIIMVVLMVYLFGAPKPITQDTIPCDFAVSNTGQTRDVGSYLQLTSEHNENTSEYDSATNSFIDGDIIGNICGKEIGNPMLDESAQLCPVDEIIHSLAEEMIHSKEEYVLKCLRSKIYRYIREYNSEQIIIYVDNKKVKRIYDLPKLDTNKKHTKLIFFIKGDTLIIRNTDSGTEKTIIFN